MNRPSQQNIRMSPDLGIAPPEVGDPPFVMLTTPARPRHAPRQLDPQHMLDCISAGVIQSNAKGRIVRANAAAAELLGYAPGTLVGLPLAQIASEAARFAHEALIRRVLQDAGAEDSPGPRQIKVRRLNGTDVPISLQTTPMDTADGWMVMCTLTDLRPHLTEVETQKARNAALSLQNEELSQFVYSASHDLKAPLVSMAALLQMCLEDIEDGCSDELAAMMTQALEICGRSGAQIEGILDLARAGKDELVSEPIAIAELISTQWDSLTAAEVHAELRLDMPSEARVTTEAPTLTVILANLLSNAVKYRDPDKASVIVTVSFLKANGAVWISVADNGRGIDPAHQMKIFEMFQRFGTSCGAGLGLALVQKHVARLGGEVSVVSEPGAGSTFTFWIPESG